MKKIAILIFAFVIFFGVKTANAVSGTCSDHGGVNCSVGADWDGSAICNDGWRNSTETYNNTIKCTDNNAMCTVAELDDLRIQYGIVDKQNQIKELETQIDELEDRLQPLEKELMQFPMIILPRIMAEQQQKVILQIQSLTDKIKVLQYKEETILAAIKKDTDTVNLLCKAKGFDTQIKQRVEASINNLNQQAQDSLDQSKQALDQLIKQLSCPTRSQLGSDGKCYCDSGYIWLENTCVTYTQYCTLKYYTHVHFGRIQGDQIVCTCDDGYYFDASSNLCQEISKVNSQPAIINPPVITDVKKLTPTTNAKKIESVQTKKRLDNKAAVPTALEQHTQTGDNKTSLFNSNSTDSNIEPKENFFQKVIVKAFNWIKTIFIKKGK